MTRHAFTGNPKRLSCRAQNEGRPDGRSPRVDLVGDSLAVPVVGRRLSGSIAWLPKWGRTNGRPAETFVRWHRVGCRTYRRRRARRLVKECRGRSPAHSRAELCRRFCVRRRYSANRRRPPRSGGRPRVRAVLLTRAPTRPLYRTPPRLG
jgi:hypothetical protein